MTFDEAMHTECDYCGEQAQFHRMTDSGNFYCLQPVGQHDWRKRYVPSPERRQWAISIAKCNELRKSPLSSIKAVGEAIVAALRTPVEPSPIGDQMSL